MNNEIKYFYEFSIKDIKKYNINDFKNMLNDKIVYNLKELLNNFFNINKIPKYLSYSLRFIDVTKFSNESLTSIIDNDNANILLIISSVDYENANSIQLSISMYNGYKKYADLQFICDFDNFNIYDLKNAILEKLLYSRIYTKYMNHDISYYHNIYHVYNMLNIVNKLNIKNELFYKDLIIAICYHDSKYIPGNKFNEEQSIDNLFNDFPQLKNNENLKRLILCTKVEFKEKCEFLDAEKIIHDLDFIEFSNYDKLVNNNIQIKNEFVNNKICNEKEFIIGRLNFFKMIKSFYGHNIYISKYFMNLNDIAFLNVEKNIEIFEKELIE